jgi:large subunit ribosomal protein L12
MEYIYAALLIHKAGKPVNAETVKKVLQAAGVTPDDARVKALVASLEGVNIDEAVKKAALAPAAPAAGEHKETKKEEPKKSAEEEKKTEESAAAGLSALFG